MRESRVDDFRMSDVDCYILYTLTGDDELTASGGIYNSDVPLATTTAARGANFSRCNHFDARNLF